MEHEPAHELTPIDAWAQRKKRCWLIIAHTRLDHRVGQDNIKTRPLQLVLYL
jgi:hypothetical protein